MHWLIRFVAIVCILQAPSVARSRPEQPAPVTWRFKIVTTGVREAVLYIEASIAPGWHIYSQHLRPGGPIPTKFTFNEHKAYAVIGNPEEEGNAVRFYDNLYEMDITWYDHEVKYTQKIILNQWNASITGIVEYMVCNDHVCIPIKHEFSVEREQVNER